MAKIRFQCACGKNLAVEDRHAGKVAKCPACGRPVVVPQPETEADGAPPLQAERDMAQQVASFSKAYGAAMLAKARRERAEAALAEYRRRARKRNLVIAAAVAATALLAFTGYRLFRTCGVRATETECPDAFIRRGLRRCAPLVRAAAAWELADAEGADATPVLARLANDPEPIVQWIAACALARRDPEAAEQHLRPLLAASDLDVRMTAAFLLARCTAGDLRPRTLAPFVQEALARNPEWQAWFQDAAGDAEPTEQTKAFLEEKARSEDTNTRRIAAWVTSAVLGVDARAGGRLLLDRDPRVAVSAIRSLGAFTAKEEFDRLLRAGAPASAVRERFTILYQISQRVREEEPRRGRPRRIDRRIRTAAALVVAWSGQDPAAAWIRPALTDRHWFLRFVGAQCLSALSSKVALEAIRSAGKDEDSNEWVQRVLRRIQARKPKPETGKDDEPDD